MRYVALVALVAFFAVIFWLVIGHALEPKSGPAQKVRTMK